MRTAARICSLCLFVAIQSEIVEANAQVKDRSMQLIELGGGLVQTEALAKRLAVTFVAHSRDMQLTEIDDSSVKVERLPESWLVRIQLGSAFSIDTLETGTEYFIVEISVTDAQVLRYETEVLD